MDPVSAAASIIAVLQIATAVLTACNDYCRSVKQAPKEAEQIQTELGSLKLVLEQLLLLAEKSEASVHTQASVLGKLAQKGGELDACLASLTELQAKLQPQNGWKGVKTALTWHFKEGEFRKILAKLAKSKDTLNLAVTADTALVTLSIQDEVAILSASFQQVSVDAQQQKALDWLRGPDASENHYVARTKQEASTGSWFLEASEFKSWKSSKPSVLWLHGIRTFGHTSRNLIRKADSEMQSAGCGKTVLCSSIIQAIDQDRKSQPNTCLAFFYFDFNDSNKGIVSHMLRSLITQLATQHVDALAAVVAEYTQHNQGRQQPSLRVLSDLLPTVLGLFGDSYLVIDALDECKDREDLLDWLNEVLGPQPPNTHILLASRKEKDIHDVLGPLITSQVEVQGSAVDADIRRYVHGRLQRDRKLKKWPDTVKDEIEQAVNGKAKGMFRWTVCQLDMLGKCNTIVALRKGLETMPRTLDETYNRILSEVDEQHIDDVVKVLQWLCFSARPILLTEMTDVLAVDINESFQFNPDLRYTDPQDILGICSSLVRVQPRKIRRDPWEKRIEDVEQLGLAHFSVKEYLVSERLQTSIPKFCMSEGVASARMAEVCLAYLVQFDTYSFLTKKNIAKYPLATYAAFYWTRHARAADDILATGAYTNLAHKLLSEVEICRNWLSLWDPDSRVSHQSDLEYIDLEKPINDKELKTPLYYACLAGLLQLARLMLEGSGEKASSTGDSQPQSNPRPSLTSFPFAKAELNEMSGLIGSVLQAAARAGNAPLVNYLIESGANVNIAGGESGCALSAAAEQNKTEAVFALLAKGADVNVPGGFHGTCLQAASYVGNEKMVAALLEHGAEVNRKAGINGYAIVAAAARGHEAIVDLLISHGADIDARSEHEETALYEAAGTGQLRIVKLLLAKGANVHVQGYYGGTALMAAARGKSAAIVKLLLEEGADPNAADGMLGSPIQQAASEGASEVVKLLIDAGADVNLQVGDYGSPLAEAARYGHEEVVDILLANGADAKGGGGSSTSPLQGAMAKGKLQMARKFIANGADVNEYSGDDGFALHSAASAANLTMVNFLLENGADVNARGGLYGTALQAVAAEGRKSSLPVAEALIKAGADVNAKGGCFGSPLHACGQTDFGTSDIARLLLKYGADPNLRHNRDATPLHAAAMDGKHNVAKVLLNAGADVEARNKRMGTPLHCALQNGSSSIATLLLEHSAAINNRGEDENDLQMAAYNGLTDVVRMIMKRGGSINIQHGSYATALQAAAIEGQITTIEFLLDNGADVNATGGQYGTALQAAAMSENLKAVKTLVERGADIHIQGGTYYTALQAAACAGEEKTVQYLIGLGADVNVQGGEYGNALQAACQSESRKAVMALLAAGANVNAQGGELGNALQAAASQFQGDETVVKTLIEAGADVNAQGGRYGNALQAAAQSSNVGIGRLLISHGADVNAKGGEYGYAILAALEAGSLEMAELLLANGADLHVSGPEGGP